jgi:hypothetical protein
MEKMSASFLPLAVDRLSPAEIEDLMQDDLMARAFFRSLLLQKGKPKNPIDTVGVARRQWVTVTKARWRCLCLPAQIDHVPG